ncbi:hypothetical protein [Elioraea rosea]|uniref:hypothetical protein n=1 Tax=Elioraea rosea TaxID=2492390 RepID=UPI0011839559|nr:hypothetical protein [Elioraea rosea]
MTGPERHEDGPAASPTARANSGAGMGAASATGADGRLVRLWRFLFWAWQGLSLFVLACLGLALLAESLFWNDIAAFLGAIGIMAVLVILPAWVPVTLMLGGAWLLARAWSRRRSPDARRGA